MSAPETLFVNGLPFDGFDKPRSNWTRIPNEYFDLLYTLRQRAGKAQLLAPIKVLMYVARHTWGNQNYDSPIRLSFSEIERGRKTIGGGRMDAGTALDRKKSIPPAVEFLRAWNVLEVTVDDRDAARVMRYIRLKLDPQRKQRARPDAPATPANFHGFERPESNWWIVPSIWTDLCRGIRRETTIIGVEYFFRHTWGWNQGGDTTRMVEMSVDEVAAGRYFRDAAGQVSLNAQRRPTRIDAGIRYSRDRVYDALEEAANLNLLVRAKRANPVTGLDERVYLLRWEGAPQGELTQLPVIQSSHYFDVAGEAILGQSSSETPPLAAGTPPGMDGIPPLRDQTPPQYDAIPPRAAGTPRAGDGSRQRTYKETGLNTAPTTEKTTTTQNGRADVVVGFDLLVAFGFSKQIARTLATNWFAGVDLAEDAKLTGLAQWAHIAENADLDSPSGRTGLVRNRLASFDVPAFDDQQDSWPAQFVLLRRAMFDKHPEPLADPKRWFDAQVLFIQKESARLAEEARARARDEYSAP